MSGSPNQQPVHGFQQSMEWREPSCQHHKPCDSLLLDVFEHHFDLCMRDIRVVPRDTVERNVLAMLCRCKKPCRICITGSRNIKILPVPKNMMGNIPSLVILPIVVGLVFHRKIILHVVVHSQGCLSRKFLRSWYVSLAFLIETGLFILIHSIK